MNLPLYDWSSVPGRSVNNVLTNVSSTLAVSFKLSFFIYFEY